MYLTIAILGALFFLMLFSQFGSRLPARHALVWWGVCLLILTAAIWPGFFQNLAEFLGVSLASNLIFAGLILLLIFLLVEQSVESMRNQRLIRELATRDAARGMVEELRPRWEEKKPGPKVLVVLPVFNEEDSIPELARALARLKEEAAFPLDYCFIDDGSEDASGEQLRVHAAGHCASHPVNLGVAAALMTGMKLGKLRGADFIVQCDADGQHPIEWIPRLVQEARDKRADLIIGSRYAKGAAAATHPESSPSSTVWRRFGGWLLALALRGFRLPAKITDPTSGFRIYSSKAFDFLSRRMPEEYPEPESIALLAWAGMKIEELRVPMFSRQAGVSTIRGFRTVRYMTKVLGALMGLRIRILFTQLR